MKIMGFTKRMSMLGLLALFFVTATVSTQAQQGGPGHHDPDSNRGNEKTLLDGRSLERQRFNCS